MSEPMALGSGGGIGGGIPAAVRFRLNFFFLSLQLQQQDAFNIFIFKTRLVSVETQKSCRNRWHSVLAVVLVEESLQPFAFD